jgi:hypothetical protein
LNKKERGKERKDRRIYGREQGGREEEKIETDVQWRARRGKERKDRRMYGGE